MQKYLYGKKHYLKDWIAGKQGLRLSDIAYYSIMDNEQMRDNELAKEFVYDKNQTSFSVNGVSLNPKDMVSNPVMTVFPERCFCVCLSNKKNDPQLFDRFNADVCLEIDVPNLIQLLRTAVSHLEGVNVVHDSVNYYPAIMSSPAPDLNSVLFYKRDVYQIESEYRVAIKIPPHRKFFKDSNGNSVAIFSDDPDDVRHMFVNGLDPEINTSYVTSVYYKT